MSGTRTDWTRREWLCRTAAGTLIAASTGRRVSAATPGRLGVQLYTVRSRMKPGEMEGTLKAIADIGYKEVEVLQANVGPTCKAARAVGLDPVSVHVSSSTVTGGPELDKLIAEVQPLGVRYVVVAYLMPQERTRPGFYPMFADRMNAAGEQVKKAGLQLCYHNHGFEFEKDKDGARPIDLMASRFDRQLAKFELDVFWVSMTGTDPAALLGELAGRVALVHLKDKASGAAVETQEMKVAPTTFKEVGSGTLDFPGILKAAKAAGVEHYFVEQDQTPGDPVASLKQSYSYLAGLDSRQP